MSGWTAELSSAYTSIDHLVRDGFVSAQEATHVGAAAHAYRIRIPKYYAALMQQDQTGALRRQALPAAQELQDPILPEWAVDWSRRAFGRDVPWSPDAIGDVAQLAAPRLTHRYTNRAILHTTTLCGLYCRFCFRKTHLNDKEAALYGGPFDPALDYLRAHPEIEELILTGGDPLTMTDHSLRALFDRLDAITHLRLVRIHTRMPVTLPARLTLPLRDLCLNRNYRVTIATHFNHPAEWTATARRSIAAFQERGICILNQTVLLRGVNNDVEVLMRLFQELYYSGVNSFYLHHPDWTPGTFHFRPSIAEGMALVAALRGRLAGPASPRYVVDLPGGIGKIPVGGEAENPWKLVDERMDSDLGLRGTLYGITTPQTRSAEASSAFYFDLSSNPTVACNK